MPESFEVTEWIGPDGTVVNLMEFVQTGLGAGIQPGRRGAFMPPIDKAEDKIPYQNGTRLKYVSLGARDVDFPIYLKGTSEDDLRQRMRDMVAQFNPLGDEDGRIRITRPDGTQREIICRYHQGMEILETDEYYGSGYCKCIVTFRANDPVWYDVTPQSNTYGSGAAIPFFPGTPFRLTSSAIFATTGPITNTGDLEAWPIWIVQGPGTDIALRNEDTGEKIEFLPDVILTAGMSVTIDTREGLRSVRRNDNLSLYGKLTGDSVLFPLYKGANNLRIDMQNTTEDSLVTLSYFRGFLSV